MYIHFTFKDGSNPYIVVTNKAFFDIISKYYVKQIDDNNFLVDGKLCVWTVHTNRKLSARERAKTVIRDFAIQWQCDSAYMNYSYGEMLDWQSFFSEYGRKYGLIREFRENGIPC